MRMRRKKNLVPRMERCAQWLISDPQALRGNWRSLLPGAKELRIELGCGKGRFTVETAAAEPDVLLIAVEKVPDAMVVAMERAAKAELHNVFFIDIDANQLPEIFDAGEVDRIYVNFCDPWPPKRQAKRRLTHGNFLKLYRKVLKDNGQIHFKTDNDPLFEWSIEEIPQFGFELSEVTRDLHANGQRGVMTDYEAKFYAEARTSTAASPRCSRGKSPRKRIRPKRRTKRLNKRKAFSLLFAFFQIRRIHHHRVVHGDRRLREQLALQIKRLPVELVVTDVAAPVLRAHLVVALYDRIALGRLGAHEPLALKVCFADADAHLIGVLCVVADHQVKIGVKAGRTAAEGLRAVRVGKDVVAVAVALDDRERRVQRHPVDEV